MVVTPGEAEVVLEAANLTKEVVLGNGTRLKVVDDVSLTVRKAHSYAIVGRSGSGKTSLLSILGLLSTPDQGSVSVSGRDVTRSSRNERAGLRNSNMGFIFQAYSLIPNLSVYENVQLPLLYGPPRARLDRRTAIMESLSAVGLADRQGERPQRLSGGEQQRVAVARALVSAPGIVLADEPTGALDTRTGDVVAELLFTATAQRGASLVLVTHDPELASRADESFVMTEGRMDRGEFQNDDLR